MNDLILLLFSLPLMFLVEGFSFKELPLSLTLHRITSNISTMNKRELIQKIKKMNDLSTEEKAFLIESVNTKKKYGLVWENKPEDVEEQLRSMLPVLKEDTKKAIISEDKNAPNHILIEGDNLHALTTLSYTHEGKIDVIYIDPPYNTGNKDFIYNDKYVDIEDTYRHSKWLSFMDKRLKLAKKLLSETGTIFISIDDNEVAQLKVLCNEVFGENNFVGQWNWFKSATPPNLSLKIKKNIEYVLAYEKSRTRIKYQGVQKHSKSDDPFTKPQNTLKELSFPPKSINFKIKSGVIKAGIYGTKKYPNKLLNDVIIENYKNKCAATFENRFIWIQNKLEDELKKGTVVNCSKSIVLSYKKQNYSKEVPPNLIDENVGVTTTEKAGQELIELFGKEVFDYPKPTSLIKYLLQFKENTKILDFFAGSGTTLHAVMELNEEDGGNRQCILVTNNENNIAKEVTYERNKRVIQGYTNAKGEEIEGLKHNNLRYYKTEFISSTRSEINRRKLTAQSTELLCIKEDCYTDITKDYSLDEQSAKIFTNNQEKYLIVMYYSRNLAEQIEQLTEIIQGLSSDTKIVMYAFGTEKEVLEEDFYAVKDKVEIAPLPDCIYNTYQNVFKTLKIEKDEIDE